MGKSLLSAVVGRGWREDPGFPGSPLSDVSLLPDTGW